MVFSSPIFIFAFLPFTLLCYLIAYKLRRTWIMNMVLLLASFGFYAWGGLNAFLLLLLVIAVNWGLTLGMDGLRRKGKTGACKAVFLLILAIDLGNLFYFKYAGFFAENIARLKTLFGAQISSPILQIALPIGISFYTFQIISYVADVYTEKVEVQRNPLKLALYVMMFPQLIAGPIVRYKTVCKEIDSRTVSIDDAEEGIRRFITGFAKKVLLANMMGSMADEVFASAGGLNTAIAWIGVICYAFQIYYDFSAYSDMAIGIGRMLGFHFEENFDLPYRSTSLREFWRRWHMSLSGWFRDYVYIPMGGSRCGLFRNCLNLAVVFLLTGFWHGAAWQFIVWGLLHGFFVIIERVGFGKVLDRIPKAVGWFYTALVVLIGWVFFRADSLSAAGVYLKAMFSFDFESRVSFEVAGKFTPFFVLLFTLSLVFSFTRAEGLKKFRVWNNLTFTRLRFLVLFALSVLYLIGLSYNPFIYFRF